MANIKGKLLSPEAVAKMEQDIADSIEYHNRMLKESIPERKKALEAAKQKLKDQVVARTERNKSMIQKLRKSGLTLAQVEELFKTAGPEKKADFKVGKGKGKPSKKASQEDANA